MFLLLKQNSLTYSIVSRDMPSYRSRPDACNFIKKETLAQVFSCKFCEIFKNTFLTEHLQLTASEANALFFYSLECRYRKDHFCKINTAQKMKFSINDLFSKCDQIRRCGLVTSAEEILNGKLHFLCSVRS